MPSPLGRPVTPKHTSTLVSLLNLPNRATRSFFTGPHLLVQASAKGKAKKDFSEILSRGCRRFEKEKWEAGFHEVLGTLRGRQHQTKKWSQGLSICSFFSLFMCFRTLAAKRRFCRPPAKKKPQKKGVRTSPWGHEKAKRHHPQPKTHKKRGESHCFAMRNNAEQNIFLFFCTIAQRNPKKLKCKVDHLR